MMLETSAWLERWKEAAISEGALGVHNNPSSYLAEWKWMCLCVCERLFGFDSDRMLQISKMEAGGWVKILRGPKTDQLGQLGVVICKYRLGIRATRSLDVSYISSV